jgi:hypothetical protein
MTRILSYNFPAVNNSLSVICATQDTAGAGNLILNGDFVEPITGTMSFKNRGYSRNVSFTLAGNASVDIKGTENGVIIEENGLVIGGGILVYSANTYDTITSITVDQAVIGISVGGGLLGFFGPLGGVLSGDGFPFWTVSVLAIDAGFTGTPQFNLYGSLNNLVNTDTYASLIFRQIVAAYGQGGNPFQAPKYASQFDTFNQLIVELILDDPADGINFAYTNLVK